MTQMTEAEFVLGWVERFNFEKSFGFVQPLPGGRHPAIGKEDKVFIHASQCRVFEGTPEKPEIGPARVTRDWASRNVRPAMGPGSTRRGYSYVAMRVERGDKGPRAAAWTVVPRRQTVEDVLRFGGLETYLKMEVAILPTGRNATGGLWGTLAAWSLTESRLCLTLTSPRGSGGVRLEQDSIIKEVNFTNLRVNEDDPHQLTLHLTRDNEPALQVVCWRRPPR